MSPGHMTARTQRAAAVAPGELDDLERHAGDERHAEDAREHEPVPRGQPDRREHEDGDDHHDEQEARPAARVQPREALGVLGRERQPGLVAGDRLVLGAVVLEHAAQVAHPRQQADVAEEDRGAQDPLDEPEQERRAELVLDQARQADGDDEEQADRRAAARATTVPAHMPPEISSSSSPSWALAEMPSALKPMASDSPRATTPRTIGRRSSRWRLSTEVSGNDCTSMSPSAASPGGEPALGELLGQRLANGDRPGGDAAHHDALEDGLAAHGGVALRPQPVRGLVAEPGVAAARAVGRRRLGHAAA